MGVNIKYWILSKFRCGSRRRSVGDSKEEDLNVTDDEGSSDDREVSDREDDFHETRMKVNRSISPRISSVVSLTDSHGFEWAINDSPPPLRAGAEGEVEGGLLIPFAIRPMRGFLKNQVLTNTEIPDISTPTAVIGATRPLSSEQEHVIRQLRACALDMSRNSGSHIRCSQTRRKIVRNDATSRALAGSVADSSAASTATSSTTVYYKRKPPLPDRSVGRRHTIDVNNSKTFLATRAAAAAAAKRG